MSRLLRIFATVSFLGTFAAGALALSPGAGADLSHHARLIDTDLVVGSPQNSPLPVIESARPGDPVGRGGAIAPSITTQPENLTVASGATATFSAAASGTPTPSVQWYVSTNAGRSWSSIRGATSTTFSFTASSSESGDELEALFRNTAGSATTNPATLTVGATTPVAPTITTQPESQTVTAGSTASFSAAASGTPPPTVQWYESTNGGSTFGVVGGATSTTYAFSASSTESGDEFYALFSNTAGTAQSVTVTLTVTVAPAESSNWSGYADLDATFSSVSASWTVPTLTCSGRSSTYSAQWVGIDGYSSSTVEQDGTEADCIGGAPSYDAWYEMYGDSTVNSGDEVELSPATNPISPGDTISASVNHNAGSWTLALTDDSAGTQRWTFSTVITFATAQQSSAEWVVERPEICSRSCSLTALADFGSVTFTGASTTTAGGTGSISSNSDTAIEMVNGSTTLATPSALDPAGNSFTDTWQAG